MRIIPIAKFTSVVIVSLVSGLLVFPSAVTGSSQPQFSGPPPISQPELSATQRSASTNQTCTLTPSLIEIEDTPQQIEGPYFVDDMPNRSDIRSDTSNGSIQEGVPLRLVSLDQWFQIQKNYGLKTALQYFPNDFPRFGFSYILDNIEDQLLKQEADQWCHEFIKLMNYSKNIE